MIVKVNKSGYIPFSPSGGDTYDCPTIKSPVAGSGATDYDGNIYTSVIIGTQEWIVGNLRVTHYNDGVAIPFANSDASWNQYDDWSDGSVGVYSYVNKDVDTSTSEGLIYNRYACTENLPISGWRLPTQADVSTLIEYVDGDYSNLLIDSGWDLTYPYDPYWPIIPCQFNGYGSAFTPSGRRYLTNINNRGESAIYFAEQDFSNQTNCQYFNTIPYPGLSYEGIIYWGDDNLFDNNGLTVKLIKN